MRLPEMKHLENRSQKTILQFLGINYGENTRDGQLADCRNLSARMFPCLCQRPGRELQVGSYENATAVWYRNGLIVVDGIRLMHNGAQVGTVSPGKKQFANVNSKVVIFPDKVLYDTESKEFRSLVAEYTSAANALEFTDDKTLKVHLGSYRAEITGSGTTVEAKRETWGYNSDGGSSTYTHKDPVFEYQISSAVVNSENGKLTVGTKTVVGVNDVTVGMLFIDSSLGLDGVTSYGKITKFNDRNETTIHNFGVIYTESIDYRSFNYDRYEVKGTDYAGFSGFESMNFRAGDTVEITGCTTYPDNNKTATIRSIAEESNDAGTLYSLVFDQKSFTKGAEAGAVTIKRSVPDLTVICEKDNRLYGAAGHTIYVSALGDPTNFNTFDGVDTDSYSVAVATEGNFTGCIGYGSSVLFFKEDRLHKLMGSYPSQYTMYDYTVPGVAKGSENSLWNINEVVYYHGRDGVYRYSGGAPDLITEEFGLRRYDTAAAGAAGDLYYISMQDRDSGAWGMWVYDTMRGLWLQEDTVEAVDFARDGGKLYYIDAADSSLVLANAADSKERVAWSAELCRMDEVYLNRKCYSKVLMRMELEEDAWVKIEVACDGGEWVEHKLFRRGKHQTVLVPIRPNRCDSFQIRLTGEGGVVIRSLVREFELGSDY